MSLETLGDALPRELARNRKLLVAYKSIGAAGAFGAMMIEADIGEAERALGAGDIVAMVLIYPVLRDNV